MGSLFYWKEIREVAKLVVEVNRDNFEKEVVGSKEPVLVDFGVLNANLVLPSCLRLRNWRKIMSSIVLTEKKFSIRRKVITGLLAVVVLVSVPVSAIAEDAGSINALKQMGKAFSGIAKKALPAVVGLKTEKTVTYRSPFGNSPFDDEFFDFFFQGLSSPKDSRRITPSVSSCR
jgi:hypothetical protein